MIHHVRLAPLIRECLGEVVALQMSLLSHAASRTNLDETVCAQHLERVPRFKGRGSAIAKWIWASTNRIGPLEQFAIGPTADKRRLARRVRRDAMRLLWVHSGRLTPWPATNALWEKAAADFLKQFYIDLCGESGLPACIFSNAPPTGKFGRPQFFEAFEAFNSTLEICAICDETGFVTKPRGTYRGEIDHYFPKSRYPHLACHPLNLVPTCHSCNALIKLSRDPLDGNGKRYLLEEIFIPYRGGSCSERAYLKIHDPKLSSATFEELKPRHGYDLREAPSSFEVTYEIPSRWQARNKNIGVKIFQELKARISLFTFSPAPDAQVHEMVRLVDALIGELYERQGADPYRFAMTWWLAKICAEELIPFAEGKKRHSSFWDVLRELIINTGPRLHPVRIPRTAERRGRRMRQEVG